MLVSATINTMNSPTEVTLSELEAAINWWRVRHPAQGDAMKLSPQVAALATAYALLIWQGKHSLALSRLNERASQAFLTFQEAIKNPPPQPR